MATSNVEKEIWELTVPGRVSVEVLNSQNRPQTLTALGKGQRLRVTTAERALIEEAVRDEQNNPFRNGMLVRVGRKDQSDASDDELGDDDLAGLFGLKGKDFEDAVGALSEVNVRRLKVLTVEKDAARSQVEHIDAHIEATWPIGADTPSNAEARGDRTVTAL